MVEDEEITMITDRMLKFSALGRRSQSFLYRIVLRILYDARHVAIVE
jgi:hypothetical protein